MGSNIKERYLASREEEVENTGSDEVHLMMDILPHSVVELNCFDVETRFIDILSDRYDEEFLRENLEVDVGVSDMNDEVCVIIKSLTPEIKFQEEEVVLLINYYQRRVLSPVVNGRVRDSIFLSDYANIFEMEIKMYDLLEKYLPGQEVLFSVHCSNITGRVDTHLVIHDEIPSKAFGMIYVEMTAALGRKQIIVRED